MRSLYSLHRHLFCLVTIAAVITLLSGVPASAEDLRLTYIQGLVGAAGFDEDQLTFAETTSDDTAENSTNDLSTMPYVGFAGQFPFSRAATHIGIDASLLFGWRSDDTSVVAGNNQARIEIDSDLWLVDMAIGLYAQTILGNRWRLYGAVGPMII